MGAWGMGNFENNSASDWVYDLTETDNLNLVISSLQQVVKSQKPTLFKKVFKANTKVIEEPFGSEAMAAAEVIAGINGNHSSDFPMELSSWVKQEALGKDLIEWQKKRLT